MSSNLATFNKLFISLRYYLLGMAKHDREYVHTYEMLEYAKEIHTGTRKDKVTPEFQHQLEIAHYVRTLGNSVRKPALVIGLSLGHDILEDYSNIAPFVTHEQIQTLFGSQYADEMMLISKEYKGKKLSTDEYYSNMLKSRHCTIAKGADRINNQGSMDAVWNSQKQLSYVTETESYILPMLKNARRKFFDQELAYENIKFVLKSQNKFVKAACSQIQQ